MIKEIGKLAGRKFSRCPVRGNIRTTTKECMATVYHKHRSLQTRKGKYRGRNLTGARRLRRRVFPQGLACFISPGERQQ